MASVLKKAADSNQDAPHRDHGGLAGFNLADLANEGRTRLDECRKQARELLDQARQEAEAIRAEAEKKGYEDGMKEAADDFDRRVIEEATIRARDGLHLLEQAVEQMRQTHQSWLQEYADSLSRVAIAAAERVVLNQLDRERDLLVRWAGEALSSTRTANQLTVAVHPETLAELGVAFDRLLAAPGLPEQTHVEPDPSVDRNGVVVRQLGGEIDAGLSAQLRRLEELLS